MEELNNEEQKEFSKLLDKNEDLFRESEKLKFERDKYKRNFEEIVEELNTIKNELASEKKEKDKYIKYAERKKNKKKALKIDLGNLQYFFSLKQEIFIEWKKRSC